MLDNLQRPCSVFVTFESEEGYQRALNYNSTLDLPDYKQYSTLLGQEIEIVAASEPSDIIWENRYLRPHDRLLRTAAVSLVVLVLLCFSFSIIFVS